MKKETKKEILSWMKSIAAALVIALICRQFLFMPTTVLGASMQPSFEDHDRVLVSKIGEAKRFDVVVFDAPDISGEHYIKRVIGLPGDHLEVKDDTLYVNGEPTDEPYLELETIPGGHLTEEFTLEEKTGHRQVPAGKLFVMGDNRLNSKDSRTFGFISEESVIGKVKLRIYPFSAIGIP